MSSNLDPPARDANDPSAGESSRPTAAAPVEELVGLCRATVGDSLRSVIHFTRDDSELLYLRTDLYGNGPCVLSSSVRGEAREAALTHVAVAEEIEATGNPLDAPAVVLSGGEATVTVRGDGVGGPNAEFALSAAIELPGGATLACVDTDGKDGSSDFAGALVDADIVDDAREARAALGNSDAYGYLGERGAVISTGATGTNVNDLRVLVDE